MNELPLEPASTSAAPRAKAAAGAAQFIKFCVVGVSNLLIDYSISYVLTFHFGLWWVLAQMISFSVAVTNSFFWNRRWTFQAHNGENHAQQYVMFFTVNIIGLALNLGIMKTVFFAFTHSWHGQPPQKIDWMIAKMSATVIVVLWNFGANKHWTFKTAH